MLLKMFIYTSQKVIVLKKKNALFALSQSLCPNTVKMANAFKTEFELLFGIASVAPNLSVPALD